MTNEPSAAVIVVYCALVLLVPLNVTWAADSGSPDGFVTLPLTVHSSASGGDVIGTDWGLTDAAKAVRIATTAKPFIYRTLYNTINREMPVSVLHNKWDN
jgi:hypothetical protein